MKNLLFFVVLFLPFSAFGQETTKPQISGIVGPSIEVSGSYQGDIATRDGSGYHAFDIILTQKTMKEVVGTTTFYKADVACRQPASVTGAISDDGTTVELKAPGVVQGCDRTFTLKVLSDKLSGELSGPKGTWKVTLTKQK